MGTHDRAAHHPVALNTRNRTPAARPQRSLRRLEARDSTRDEAAFHQHTCLLNSCYGSYIATRDMAHSELKAYSSDEEIEDAHKDEISEIAQLPKLRPGCAGWTHWSSTDRGCPRARRDGGRGSSQ